MLLGLLGQVKFSLSKNELLTANHLIYMILKAHKCARESSF